MIDLGCDLQTQIISNAADVFQVSGLESSHDPKLQVTGLRGMKSPLAERPLEHRVESDVFVCLLAFHPLVAIETTLRDQGVHTSWAAVRDVLKTHQVSRHPP